ncbi:MAG: ComF family protein [Fibrobacter sp.]|nr:ComF family protein [Fibrobacter sp.]
MDIVQTFENFVFGMECLGCGTPGVPLDPWLCSACRAELRNLAQSAMFPGEDVCCLFPMRPLTRNLIHSLKYRTIPGMAMYLVKRSSAVRGAQVGQMLAMLSQPLYFVPVPLHRARYRERGYNQAEKIAGALASVTGGKVCRWLKRRKFVVSQTKLSREERELNVAGVFEASLPRVLPGRGTVVVVDDVYTTGATTNSCLGAFGRDFPLPLKVCTLLYEEPVTAVADFVADCRAEWDVEERRRRKP